MSITVVTQCKAGGILVLEHADHVSNLILGMNVIHVLLHCLMMVEALKIPDPPFSKSCQGCSVLTVL